MKHNMIKISKSLLNVVKDVYFTGIQPTGNLHLGNYFGAIQPILSLQSNKNIQSILCIADLHSLTILPNNKLNIYTQTLVAYLLAIGLDTTKTTIFVQSQNLNHCLLNWILSCFTNYNNLTKMTQFKDKLNNMKLRDSKASLCLGLFSYPVLQAADILLYKTKYVPVGEDQLQHIELVRSIAEKFNRKVDKEVFIIPKAIINNNKKILSLRDPTKKMSKSDISEGSKIDLCDSLKSVYKKIQLAITDSIPELYYDPEQRPGVSNLLRIYDAITNKNNNEDNNKETKCIKELQNMSIPQMKQKVSESIVDLLDPIQKEANRIIKDKLYLDSVLKTGLKKSLELSQDTMEEVKKVLGLV